MKFLKSISLFILCPCLFMGIGYIGGSYLEQLFYPGKSLAGEADREQAQEEKNAVVSVHNDNGDRITADTIWCIRECNRIIGQEDEECCIEKSFPVKYIGLDREMFLEEMELYELSPPFSELQKGFVSLEVTSFSEDKVEVSMYYQDITELSGFYLTVEKNIVTVYLEDKETLYLNTGIFLPDLPSSLQQEIIHGKMLDNKAALDKFLVSYQS